MGKSAKQKQCISRMNTLSLFRFNRYDILPTDTSGFPFSDIMENIGQSFFIQFRVLSVSQEPTFLQEKPYQLS